MSLYDILDQIIALVLRKNAAAIMQVVLRDHSHGANGPSRKQLSKGDTLLPISHPRGVQIRLGSCQCHGEYPAEFQF
jgi:hypothetical protein